MLAYFHGTSFSGGGGFGRFLRLTTFPPFFISLYLLSLSVCISEIMGGGEDDQMPSYADVTGHLFLAWPFDEPKAILSRIQRRYPNLQITYQNMRDNKDVTQGLFFLVAKGLALTRFVS